MGEKHPHVHDEPHDPGMGHHHPHSHPHDKGACHHHPVEAPPPPPPEPTGILTSAAELAPLPMSGTPWTSLLAVADGDLGTPDISDQANRHAVKTLAVALVAARTGDPTYTTTAKGAIDQAVSVGDVVTSNTVLAVGRSLGAYCGAADLIGHRPSELLDWVQHLRDDEIGSHGRDAWRVLRTTSENTSSNWGMFALASRVAASLLLEDSADVATCWQVFGALGDGSWPFVVTADFESAFACYADSQFIGIGPSSCVKDGVNLSGCSVEDASRLHDFPHPHGDYTIEGVMGLVFSSLCLSRSGYPAWDIHDQMVLRVADYMVREDIWLSPSFTVGDHLAWVVNPQYGTTYPTRPAGMGRLLGWTDWWA